MAHSLGRHLSFSDFLDVNPLSGSDSLYASRIFSSEGARLYEQNDWSGQQLKQVGVRLSIVVAAWNGPVLLRQCLMSLVGQAGAKDTEVVVASNFDCQAIEDLLHSLPCVKLFVFPSDTTVPELRTFGIEKARGDIVALLEDHSIVDQRWAEQIQKAHKLPYSIIGGPVENASGGILNWAVYFYDYGKYMLPDRARVVESLSGNNVSYKSDVLKRVRDKYREGLHETFIHQELQRRGYDLYLIPSAIVYHTKNYALRASVIESYHHGRLFAARRVCEVGFAERAVRAAMSFALPVLLTLRIVARTLRKARHVRELILAAPCILLLMTAWAYGECRGYLGGEGASAGQWK
jgi:glycosyltransferase involved in cell wall biosynthesis